MSADGLWHGFLRTGGILAAVNVPLATQTFVGGINNADAVAGWSQKGSDAPRAFVLSGTRLRAFEVKLPGVIAASQAQALNDSGQVVGNYYGSGCPNGCGFLATPQVGGVPACDQSLTLEYAAGTLKMKFTGLRTSAPYTWSVLLFAVNTWVPWWSVALPPVSPAVTVERSFAVPPVGNIVGVSMFTGATGEVACADFATVNATN